MAADVRKSAYGLIAFPPGLIWGLKYADSVDLISKSPLQRVKVIQRCDLNCRKCHFIHFSEDKYWTFESVWNLESCPTVGGDR